MLRGRGRRWAKWAGVAACLLLAAMWAYSGWQWPMFKPRPRGGLTSFHFQRGEISIQFAKTLSTPSKLPPSTVEPSYLTVIPARIAHISDHWEWNWPRRTVWPAITGLTGGATR